MHGIFEWIVFMRCWNASASCSSGSVGRWFMCQMLFRAAIVLELDVTAFDCSATSRLAPFMGCNAGEDEKYEVHNSE